MGAYLRRLGAPDEEIEGLRDASMPARQFVEFATPDVLLRDGQRPDIPGWDLTAVWTPGHSPGHLCFWEPANQLMLTGDCVLPRITRRLITYGLAAADGKASASVTATRPPFGANSNETGRRGAATVATAAFRANGS